MNLNVDEIFMMDSMTDSSPHDFQNFRLQDVDNKIRALKLLRNTLVPVAGLPTEILSIIFPLLHIPSTPFFLSHVCHRWREISLNLPCLWSYINLTQLTPACAAEMLTRAKITPLQLKAAVKKRNIENVTGQIEAHIHHTRHLSISANPQNLEWMFGRLISSAPSLEQLSICSHLTNDTVLVPDNLFDGIAPNLSYLHLNKCGISWVSPLLKGLRDLKLFAFPRSGRTTLNVWLDALSQMPQLARLSLHDDIPIHSVTLPPMEPGLAVVLSSLRELDILASTPDCLVVLAHLILPALNRLCVNAKTTHRTVTSQLISCVARNAYGPQDTEALQSLFIGDLGYGAAAVAWTVPWQDDTYDGSRFSVDLPDGIRLARVAFGIIHPGLQSMMAGTHHELLAALPLNHIVSLTIKDRALYRCMRAWRDYASRWNKLQRVRLFSSAVPSFQKMLEDAPRGDPLLPSLEELVLINVSLTEQKVYYLYNTLSKLVELENPITTLDLRTCIAHDWAVQLLSGIVVNVLGPTKRGSGYSYGGRRGRNGVLEEGDHGSDETSLPLGSWYTEDEDDSDSDSD